MKWESKIITHKKESRIAVYFEKNPDFIARIKQLDGARWSQTLGVCPIPKQTEYDLKSQR
jgi:integrase/recombinase XerD